MHLPRLHIHWIALLLLSAGCTERITPSWMTWQPAQSQQIRALHFFDEKNGIAAGGVRFDEDLLLQTEDGGSAWKAQPPLFGQSLFALSFLDANRGFAAGMSGKVLRTLDAGQSWTLFQIPFWKPMHGIQAVNDSLVVAVGGNGYDDGIIVRSTDFGSTWAVIDTLDRELRDLTFVNSHTGFACGYGAIYKTTDGGLSWSFTPADGEFFSAMSFPSIETGYAVGRSGSILKTVDGGSSWQTLRSGSAITRGRHFYNDVVFLDPETGYLVGDQGLLMKTTDGGKTWQKFERPEKVDFFSIYMIREKLGFIGAAEGTLIRFEE